MKKYSKHQLALRNGQDLEEVWCAYKGIIYDLTDSNRWVNGKHYEHWSGQDLTEELREAPHQDWVFNKFRKVGYLIKENA